MKKNTDRLLKVLIVIATLIILSTLAVLAFLNFSAESARNNREQTTAVRKVTSSTNAISTTENSDETSEESTTSIRKVTTNAPLASVRTQKQVKLEEAIKENANEGRGERVSPAVTEGKSFATQAEAHEYGLREVVRLSREEGKVANYVIKADRDSNEKVTSWVVEITIN